MVVSTQCKSCRANFQVVDGKGVVRSRPVTRLAVPRKDSDPEPDSQVVSHKAKPYLKKPAAAPAPQSFFRRMLNPPKPDREITCFNCNYSYQAIAEAQSSQCPKCSGYISLQDYQITNHWNKRIQTCGDVVIQKSGVVSGVTLQCRNLLVIGELSGSVECTGDFTMRSHGKIVGKVRCRNLRIEKGAKVEFLNPVSATAAFIDGSVRGQISCTGSVTLEKRAHLQGLVRTASLVVKPGAKHTGTIEMLPGSPAE